MMRDVVGLMDALGIDAAHLVGVSMGGMISQLMAIHEPQRVLSLTSIMSTTGDRSLPGPRKHLTRHYARGPASQTDEARLAFLWQTWRILSSQTHPLTDEELAEFLRLILSRGVTSAGIARQTLAILAAPSRVQRLGQLRVPTLVIHGDQDPLFPPECGRATATAIPGARLVAVPEMGHDLPLAILPRICQQISQHLKSVG
jgi:pimeloyl-ACP methyl ester carboxylesterase